MSSVQSIPESRGSIYWPKNESFRLLVEGIKDYAIFMLDAQGFVVTWNKGAENIKGYTDAEIIGKHVSVFYTQQEAEQNIPAQNLGMAAANGSYESESLLMRKDGTLFWGDVVFTALYNEDGCLQGFANVTRDVTEKKKNRSKLVYLAKLIEKTTDAVFSYNSYYKILSWNNAAASMFGYTAVEVIDKNTFEVFRTEMDTSIRLRIREDIIEKRSWAGEVLYRHKNGAIIPVYMSVTATTDAEESVQEYVCICRDITEQKKAEKEAQQLQAKVEYLIQEKLDTSLKEVSDYKYALDKASIVAITDQHGTIKYVNENFCAVSKYSQEELIGRDHRIINSGYHPEEFMRSLWDTIASGNVWKGEIKNKAKNGTYYWVDTTIVPFLDENSKPYQYIAIRADITNRKNAEDELHRLNEQLEEHIKTRTCQYEIANQELESFSYSVSHDLRAPLRGISGFSRILQEDYGQLLDEEGNRILNKIMANASNMGQLIDDLLTFSRIGRRELTQGDIDMTALVGSCFEELDEGEDTVRYQTNISSLPHCIGDATLIKQVWLNLLGNAIKYSSKKSEALITVGCIEETARLVYFVSDNGVGFDIQYAHKLFGVFQRLHRLDEFPGTGVGLALVKLIINKHHGEVWADAELGSGATFYFSLPKKQFL